MIESGIRSEWKNVYIDIYSGDSTRMKYALGRIAVWKCRMTQRISAAIECTEQLCSIIVTDVNFYDHKLALDSAIDVDRDKSIQRTCDSDYNNNHGDDHSMNLNLRLLYSIAIIRFVNLLTDKLQTKLWSQPVHAVARELGIPEWLVEMRHDSSHSILPSLERLRFAAQFALDWLKMCYWQAELEEEESMVSGSPSAGLDNLLLRSMSLDEMSDSDVMRRVSDLLVDISQCQYQPNSDRTTADRILTNQKRRIKSLLFDLESIAAMRGSCLVSVLIDDGYLINTTEQLLALNIDINDLMSGSRSSLDLPYSLVHMWGSTLKVAHHQDLTRDLLRALVQRLNMDGEMQNGAIEKRLIAGWIYTVLKMAVRSSGGSDCDELVKYALKIVLEKPTEWTIPILTSIFSCCDSTISAVQKEQLLLLVKCYTCQSSQSNSAPYDISSLCTVEELKPREAVAQTYTAPLEQRWRLADDATINWSSLCLGQCPTKDPITYRSLDLPAEIDNVYGTVPWSTSSLLLGKTHGTNNKEVFSSKYSDENTRQGLELRDNMEVEEGEQEEFNDDRSIDNVTGNWLELNHNSEATERTKHRSYICEELWIL